MSLDDTVRSVRAAAQKALQRLSENALEAPLVRPLLGLASDSTEMPLPMDARLSDLHIPEARRRSGAFACPGQRALCARGSFEGEIDAVCLCRMSGLLRHVKTPLRQSLL